MSSIGIRKDDGPSHEIDLEAVDAGGGVTVYRQVIVSAPSGDETRFDYGARTDSSPVYIGKAPQATATTTATWTIQKFEYDSSSRCTRIQILRNVAWGANTAARDALAWS